MSTTTAYALKHMRLMGDHEAIADCQTEVETLKKLRNVPSVITLRAVAFTGAGGQVKLSLHMEVTQSNTCGVRMLSSASHLKVHAPWLQEQEAYLLLDLCRDNLVDFMRGQENKLSTAVVLHIFSAVCQAVAAMHHLAPPLAHR